MFALAMVTLLAPAFGFNPAARSRSKMASFNPLDDLVKSLTNLLAGMHYELRP